MVGRVGANEVIMERIDSLRDQAHHPPLPLPWKNREKVQLLCCGTFLAEEGGKEEEVWR